MGWLLYKGTQNQKRAKGTTGLPWPLTPKKGKHEMSQRAYRAIPTETPNHHPMVGIAVEHGSASYDEALLDLLEGP